MAFSEKKRLITDPVKDNMVGMGELKIAKGNDVLWAVLGSCIGVILYDREAAVGGLAHVMLPKRENPKDVNMGKYADTAIPLLIEQMAKNGCRKSSIKAKLVGGANMFKFKTAEPQMEIGKRNFQAVSDVLKNEGINILKSAIGGNVGYKVKFDASDGSVLIRFIDGKIIEL
jgi:chemotaxis protein CheD